MSPIRFFKPESLIFSFTHFATHLSCAQKYIYFLLTKTTRPKGDLYAEMPAFFYAKTLVLAIPPVPLMWDDIDSRLKKRHSYEIFNKLAQERILKESAAAGNAEPFTPVANGREGESTRAFYYQAWESITEAFSPAARQRRQSRNQSSHSSRAGKAYMRLSASCSRTIDGARHDGFADFIDW